MGTLLKSLGRGGEGGSFVAWLEQGEKSLSLSAYMYLAALKGVMESRERRIHHHHHHHHHGV